MVDLFFSPKGIMVLFLHAVFLAVALRRVWHKNTAMLPAKIFWSVLAVAVPVIGPFLAMGLGPVIRPHGESTPPPYNRGSGWTGGWR